MVLILYKNTNIFNNYMLILHKLTLCFNRIKYIPPFKTFFNETKTDYL